MSEPQVPDGVDRELDCRGRPCPQPILDLARALPDVPIGRLLAVVADDPAAAVDVAAFCRMRGQQYLGSRPAPDGVPTYLVRRLS